MHHAGAQLNSMQFNRRENSFKRGGGDSSTYIVSYKYNHRREGVRYANARPKVIIFCKSRPSNWQLKRIWLQEWLNIGTIENRNNAQVGQVIHFEFRFQTVHMHFGIIYQLQCHENIGNNKLICLKILVCAVWIPVWEPTKYLRIWWMRSVWKN